jgi:uncharacterized repeat protein (TIGR01451 family)
MEDVDGHPRPIGEGFDLGADESTGVDLSGSSKAASPPNPDQGDVLSYSIVLVNNGPYSATETVLFDRIPVSTTYVPGSAEATSGTFVGDPITEALTYPQGITWQGTVAPDVPVTVTFGVTVNKQTAIRNRAVITDRYGTITELTALASSYRFYLLQVLRAVWPGRQWLYLPVIIVP